MAEQRPLGGNHITYLRSCEGKTPYPSQHAAERGCAEYHSLRAPEYNTYKCEFCHHWHIGHKHGGIPRFASKEAPVIKPKKRKKK